MYRGHIFRICTDFANIRRLSGKLRAELRTPRRHVLTNRIGWRCQRLSAVMYNTMRVILSFEFRCGHVHTQELRETNYVAPCVIAHGMRPPGAADVHAECPGKVCHPG